MAVIELSTWLPAPPARCFELSLSVEAHAESMSRHREQAVAGVTSGVLRLGQSVTWKARHFGLPFTMTAVISEYDPPYRFVDEQTRGPFRTWGHEHRFEAIDGGTQMTDTVEFAAPLGPLGWIAERLVLRRYMTQLLRARNEALRQVLASGPQS